jgi:thioredoxin 1
VVSPIVETLAREYKDKAFFAKVNVDDNQAAALRYQIMGVPALLYFKEGEVKDRIVGAAPRAKIEDVLRRNLS